MIQQAFEECLFVHLSIINCIALHYVSPHNLNYRALIIKLSILYYYRYRVTTDIYAFYVSILLL